MDGKSFLPVLLGQQHEHIRYTDGIHTTRGIINGSEPSAVRSCATKTHRYIRNLHHEITCTNAVTRPRRSGATFCESWTARAAGGDAHAQFMTSKYQLRPAEELYDIVADPHCLENLIGEPNSQGLKQESRINSMHGWRLRATWDTIPKQLVTQEKLLTCERKPGFNNARLR